MTLAGARLYCAGGSVSRLAGRQSRVGQSWLHAEHPQLKLYLARYFRRSAKLPPEKGLQYRSQIS